MIQWSTVVRCSQNHPHFRSGFSYIFFRYVVRYRRNIFVFKEMYCYSFTSRKTYLVIQTWWIVRWFRYPCYDVGCYPWQRRLWSDWADSQADLSLRWATRFLNSWEVDTTTLYFNYGYPKVWITWNYGYLKVDFRPQTAIFINSLLLYNSVICRIQEMQFPWNLR